MPEIDLDLDRIVDALYDAAVDGSRWAVVWSLVTAWIGAVSGTLLLQTESDGKIDTLALPGWTEKAIGLYVAHYGTVDPFLAFGRRHRSMRAVLGQEVIPAAAYERSEIWADLGRHHMGAYHFLLAGIPVDDTLAVVLGFHRRRDALPFDNDERQRLNLILPHLRHAVRLAQRIEPERSLSAVRASVLDAQDLAVIVVTVHGQLVFATPAATREAALGGILLGGRQSGLHAEAHEEDRRLHVMIGDAASGGLGGTLLITRSSGAAPLAAIVSRLPALAAPPGLQRHTRPRLAMVTLRALRTTAGDPARFRSLFGFTSAEADVANRLLDGCPVARIASDRGASPLTVRAQIRQILMKSGARNLRELIGMLSSLNLIPT